MMVQNQSGNYPLRWDKRETIVKCEGFDHGVYVYKPLGDCPAEGRVRDILEGADPTATDHGGHIHEGQGPDHGPHAAAHDQGVVHAERDQPSPGPQRSTRAGRGLTSKYHDFVQNI